jgi:transposase
MDGAQKEAEKEGRTLVVIDETGFQMQPTSRHTWGERGQTPVIVPSAKRERISVIGALTLAPRRNRVGFYFQAYDHNIRTEEDEIEFAYLPPYAPELNPIELTWGHLKYGPLANFCPDSKEQLGQTLLAEMLDYRSRYDAIRGCFEHAGLAL